MKNKIAFFCVSMLNILVLYSFGQPPVTVSQPQYFKTYIKVKDSISLGGYNIAAIDNDSSFASNSTAKLPTQQAVKKYVDSHSVPSSPITGGYISSIPAVGDNVPSNITPDSLFKILYQKSQIPQATITGGHYLEYALSGSQNQTISFASTAQSATVAPLNTVITTSGGQTFQKGTATSGTQTVNVTNNTTLTVTNTVTSGDGKTATATTSFPFAPTMYIGFSATSTPTDSELIAGLNNIFPSFSANSSGRLAAPSSSKYIFFVSTFSTPNVTINGLSVGYTNYDRTVVNQAGASLNYHFSVSPNSTSGGVTYSTN